MVAVFGKKSPRLETPPGASPAIELPPIYVIPDEFYGAALRRPLPKMAAPSAPVKSPPAAPPPPPPAPVQPAVSAPKKKPSRRRWLLPLALLILLAGGAGAMVFFLRPAAVPVVLAPVCGDAKCEASESPFSCRQDCGAPPAVCGDAKCESSESAQSCAADCGAPAPVCGDAKCDEGETPASCGADCALPAPLPGFDADNDGLTDLEESSVFGSNARSANTDSDSFVDLNEVLNLFDPVVPAPASLSTNPHIATYLQAQLGVTLYRPVAWAVQSESVEEKTLVFAAPTGETVTLRMFEKQPAESLTEWYARTYSSGEVGEGLDVRPNRRGHDFAMHEDRARAWVQLSDTKVVGLRYDLGSVARVEFATTFAMMLASIDAAKAP